MARRFGGGATGLPESLVARWDLCVFHKVSQGPTRSHKVAQGLTRSHQVSQGLKRSHKAPQGLTTCVCAWTKWLRWSMVRLDPPHLISIVSFAPVSPNTSYMSISDPLLDWPPCTRCRNKWGEFDCSIWTHTTFDCFWLLILHTCNSPTLPYHQRCAPS